MNKHLIIAHRGESYIAPENTLSAINLAWEKGAQAIEIDVRLTKDNEVVVIHDAHTWRVARKFCWISKSKLIKLKNLDVGIYKNIKYKGEKIPTLQEVLNTVPKEKKILIEIKSDSKIIPYLKSAIDESNIQRKQVEIISFNLNTLIEVKKQFPETLVLWIRELDFYLIRKIFRPSTNKIISKVKEFNIDGLDLWAGKMLNENLADKIKKAGLKLYTWTVNNPDQAKALFEMGVDGLTTDKACWIKNQLESNF